MSHAVINSIIAILLVLVEFRKCTIPDYIHVCHKDDPDLGGCINKAIEILRPRIATGIPELKVPSLDPLFIDAISFTTKSGASYIASNITDAQILGASDFKIVKITPISVKNGITLRLEVILPELKITGKYEIDTKILVLQVKGKGPFHSTLTNYHFDCIMKGRKVPRDEVNRLEFDITKCNAVIGKISINLENLFDSNPILGKATNDAINENTEILFDEIKPFVLKSIRQTVGNIANNLTSSFTYEELFS